MPISTDPPVPEDSNLPTTPTSSNNDHQLLVAKETLKGQERSIDEAGVAEELLALASEASLSSPISRESVFTPLQVNDENGPIMSINAPTATTITIASALPPSYSTNASATTSKHICHNCSVTSTPFWRKAADGHYYCNACGLYLRTHQTQRPVSLTRNRESRRNKQRPEMCANCGAKETPMWRKSGDGATVCNACGLYWKLHGCHRKGPSAVTSSNKESTRKGRSKALSPATVSNAKPPSKNSNDVNHPQSHIPRYCLESNIFHHSFQPEIAEQRKLAFINQPNGRTTAPIAPKPQVTSSVSDVNKSKSSPILSPVPPILSTFIHTLASSPTEALIPALDAHPLQPLITSIVSEKLSRRNQRMQEQLKDDRTRKDNETEHQLLQLNQLFQQQQQHQLLQMPQYPRFFNSTDPTQQNHFQQLVNYGVLSPHLPQLPSAQVHFQHGPFLPRSATQSPLYLNINAEMEQQTDFNSNDSHGHEPRPPSTAGFLSRGQSPMTTLINKDLVDFVDFQFWADQGERQ